MNFLISFGFSAKMFIVIIVIVSSFTKSFQHQPYQKHNIFTRQVRSSHQAPNPGTNLNVVAHTNEFSQQNRDTCRESALAFYESCFNMSSNLFETDSNQEFIIGFLEACLKITISNFKTCISADK